MKKIWLAGIAAAWMAAVAPLPAAGSGWAPDLEETYQRYVRALQSRDIDALFGTLSATGVDFVTSRGQLLTSLDEYRAYHGEWFKSDDWTIDFQVEKREERGDCAYILTVWTYREQPKEGPLYTSRGVTTFLFVRENGAWKLKLDAVTPIRGPQS